MPTVKPRVTTDMDLRQIELASYHIPIDRNLRKDVRLIEYRRMEKFFTILFACYLLYCLLEMLEF